MMNDQRKDCKGGQIRNVGTGWRSGERGAGTGASAQENMVATEKTTSRAEVSTENAPRVPGL